MNPRVPSYGASGCGQADKTNGLGKFFPLACWEMSNGFWNPFSDDESGQLEAVRTLAAVQHMQGQEEVNNYLKAAVNASKWRPFECKNVLAQAKMNHYWVARR